MSFHHAPSWGTTIQKNTLCVASITEIGHTCVKIHYLFVHFSFQIFHLLEYEMHVFIKHFVNDISKEYG